LPNILQAEVASLLLNPPYVSGLRSPGVNFFQSFLPITTTITITTIFVPDKLFMAWFYGRMLLLTPTLYL